MVFSGRSAAARMGGWAVAVFLSYVSSYYYSLGTGQYIVAGRLIWIMSDRTAPCTLRFQTHESPRLLTIRMIAQVQHLL